MSKFAVLAVAAAAGVASGQFFSDFEADNGGLIASGDWEWGSPVGADGTALGGFGGVEPTGGFSGNNAWGTVLGGLHNPNGFSELTLSGVDLGAAVELSWWEWQDSGGNTFDAGRVLVDGTEVYLSDGGPTEWRNVVIDLSGFSGTGDITFEFSTTGVVERVGWYIDDLSVAVPTPGAAAVLGLGGLAAIRRRR
ncbi:MAG: hypothetical protein AAF297_02720 [Planctomycetota bacterium]